MKIVLLWTIVLCLASFCGKGGVKSEIFTEEDLKALRQPLASNALINKLIDKCPLIISSNLLYDVESKYNSSAKVPISIFVDVFRLADINDLTRR